MNVYLMYEDILVATIQTNHSMDLDSILDLISFKEEEFIEQQGFDDIDYADFKIVYKQ